MVKKRKIKKCSIRGCKEEGKYGFLGRQFCLKHLFEYNFNGNGGDVWDKIDPWKEGTRIGTE